MEKHLKNWLVLHKYLKSPNSRRPGVLRELMDAEVRGANRQQILCRLCSIAVTRLREQLRKEYKINTRNS